MLGDSVRRRQPQGKTRAPRTRARLINWRAAIPATLAALTLPFIIGYAFAVFVLFPAPKIEGTGGTPMPDLTGKTVSEAEQILVAAGLGQIETMELPHPDVPAGQILAQDPLAGQELRAGKNVRVSVSSGRPRLRVPDVEGFTADAAEQIVRRMGFDTRRIEEPSTVAAGRVIRIDPVVGAEVQLPATITIVISSGVSPIDTMGMSTDTMILRPTRF